MEIKNGLTPLQADTRDKKYLFHRNFGAVSPTNLPPDFSIDAGLTMPDQNADAAYTECTGYTTTDLATDQDLVVYTPDYSFAQTLRLMGVAPTWQGADQRMALKSAIAYGLLLKQDAPVSAKEKGQEYIADWKVWSAYVDRAIQNAKAAYYGVATGPYDAFDNIRNALWLNRAQRMGVSIGTPWFPEWNEAGRNGIVPLASSMTNDTAAVLPWHNWAVKGWKKINGQPYLIGKVWQGKNVGDNGWLYFDRNTINRVLTIQGTGAFTISEQGNRFVFLLGTLVQSFPALLQLLPDLVRIFTTEQSTPSAPAVPPAPPAVPLPPEPKYRWDTPETARHSVRLICDEEKLTLEGKNLICRVIRAESGFKNTAKLENKRTTGKVWSTDWGICQINDFYHIGPGKTFPSLQFVLDRPDEVVRFMIRMYKAGRLSLWVAYSSGAYLKFQP